MTEIEKGYQAEHLLNNDIFKEAVQSVRQAIIDKWSASPIADRDGQHELRIMLKLLNDVEANIKRFVDDGKLAKFRIEEESKLARIKRVFR